MKNALFAGFGFIIGVGVVSIFGNGREKKGDEIFGWGEPRFTAREKKMMEARARLELEQNIKRHVREEREQRRREFHDQAVDSDRAKGTNDVARLLSAGIYRG